MNIHTESGRERDREKFDWIFQTLLYWCNRNWKHKAFIHSISMNRIYTHYTHKAHMMWSLHIFRIFVKCYREKSAHIADKFSHRIIWRERQQQQQQHRTEIIIKHPTNFVHSSFLFRFCTLCTSATLHTSVHFIFSDLRQLFQYMAIIDRKKKLGKIL